MPKAITPNLWFDTQAEEAAEYYCSLFPDSRIVDVLRTPGPETVLTVDFELQGKRFTGINGGRGRGPRRGTGRPCRPGRPATRARSGPCTSRRDPPRHRR